MNGDIKTNIAGESEPASALAAMPIWLVLLMLGLLYWAALHFDRHGGWFDPKVYAPYVSIPDVQRFQPPSDKSPLFNQGRKVFQACAQCHQATGLGSTALHAPPLVDSEWVLAENPNRLIRIVLDGLQGPIEVAGKPYGTGVMTAFKSALSDEDIAAALTFIRQNPEWKHNASAVTPEQVRTVRDETKDRGTSWTAAELQKIPE